MEDTYSEKIEVSQGLFLSPPERGDISSFVSLLSEKEIYDNTIMIPYPYTDHDAESFVRLTQLRHKAYGKPLDWAIRQTGGKLAGMISFHGRSQFDPLREEVGYWLGKSFWNQGIMTSVLKRFIVLGFETYGFERLELPIFTSNAASKRVAEKCGFRFQERKAGAHKKDELTFDTDLYVISKT